MKRLKLVIAISFLDVQPGGAEHPLKILRHKQADALLEMPVFPLVLKVDRFEDVPALYSFVYSKPYAVDFLFLPSCQPVNVGEGKLYALAALAGVLVGASSFGIAYPKLIGIFRLPPLEVGTGEG